MRPIKFRAWHKIEKKMFFNVQIASPKFWSREESFSDLIVSHNWEVMQFTGLTDRHGERIFEGDIINPAHDCNLCEDEIVEVKWSEPFTGFKPFFCPDNEHDADEWEVIGNIYENPEFLEHIGKPIKGGK